MESLAPFKTSFPVVMRKKVEKDLYNMKYLRAVSNEEDNQHVNSSLRRTMQFKHDLNGAFTQPVRNMFLLRGCKYKNFDGLTKCDPFYSLDFANSFARFSTGVNIAISHSEHDDEYVEREIALIPSPIYTCGVKSLLFGSCHTGKFAPQLNRISLTTISVELAPSTEIDSAAISTSQVRSRSEFDDLNPCPWRSSDGNTRLSLFYDLRSKIISTLMERPGCSADYLHTATPFLPYSQLSLLLHELQGDQDIFSREMKSFSPLNSFDDDIFLVDDTNLMHKTIYFVFE